MASVKKCGVISDGYNFEGETDGGEMFPAIKFKFRPCTAMDKAVWIDEEKAADGNKEAIVKAQTALILKKLVSWNADMEVAGKYQPAEISEESIHSLSQENFDQILLVIISWIARTPKLREKANADAKEKADSDNELEGQEKN